MYSETPVFGEPLFPNSNSSISSRFVFSIKVSISTFQPYRAMQLQSHQFCSVGRKRDFLKLQIARFSDFYRNTESFFALIFIPTSSVSQLKISLCDTHPEMRIYETPEESYGFRQKRNSTSMFYIITSVPFPSSRFSIIFFLFVLDLEV